MGVLSRLDWAFIAVYFLLVFGFAVWATRKGGNRETSAGYFLAGRNAGWFVIGASLFASNIGSEHLIGLAGSGAAGGVAVGQFEILASLILLLLGWVFVPFYVKSGVFTMPEFLERRYSAGARSYLASISIVGYVLTKISVTIAAGGVVFESLMGIDFWTGALVVVLATGVYTVFGGLKAVLYTDTLQMFVLVAGSVAVTVIGLGHVGGWSGLVHGAGPGFFTLWKPLSDPSFPWTGIVLGAPILGVWYWCTDQFIVQRVLSARDQGNARRGAIFGGFLKVLPLFIFVVPGIVAYTLAQRGLLTLGKPDEALPTLIGQLLPVGFRGLVVAGVLAALMGSLSSVFNSCSTLITWDIYRKLRPHASERQLVWVGQLSTVALVGLGILWIPMIKVISGQLYQYLQSIQAYISPPIASVFLLGIFWKRVNARGAMAALLSGFALGLGRLVAELEKARLHGWLHVFATINFLHFAVLLFLFCSAVLVVVSLLTAAPDEARLKGLTFATVERPAPVASGNRTPPATHGWRMRDIGLSFALVAVVAGVWIYFSPVVQSPGKSPVATTAGGLAPSPRVEQLLRRMTLEEKIGQLTQSAGEIGEGTKSSSIDERYRELVRSGRVGSFLSAYGADLTHEWQRVAVEESRLHIPLLFAFDVIHGFRTTMPVPLAEASSWDAEAVELSARVGAREAAAAGIRWTFAPMVDVARDARWGRIVEGAGEDPYLGAVMAAARVRGFQGSDLAAPDALLACAKHFVAYGAAEGGRDYNTVDVSERTLREVYLPPFRAAVDAGAGSLMTAFNDLDGTPMSANRRMLRNVLRDELGFGGLVVSDWKSVGELVQHGVASCAADAARLGLTAGVDVEMASGCYASDLARLVRSGQVPESLVDEAVRRVLVTKERLGLFDDPYRYSDAAREKRETLSPENREAARQVAARSIVLLENRGHVLPLRKDVRSLAVIGPLADDRRAALGPWSPPGRAEDAVSILAGIRAAVSPATTVTYAPGASVESDDESGIAAAVDAARSADVVVLVLGEAARMSGEATSRASIELPGSQPALERAVLSLGKPTAVLLANGRPLAVPYLAAHAPAILETWFLGVETGHAVADVLFGDVNPGGKLPVTFPRATGQVPAYYAQESTGRPADPHEVWSSKYIDVAIGPLYAFGHGLSYTRFEYSGLEVSPSARAGDTVDVRFTLTNAGDRAGDEVVQLYSHDRVASVTRPVEELRAFRRVHLEAGASTRVVMRVPAEMLAFYDDRMTYVLEPGSVDLMVGSSSQDIRLRGSVRIEGERTPVAPATRWAEVTTESAVASRL